MRGRKPRNISSSRDGKGPTEAISEMESGISVAIATRPASDCEMTSRKAGW